MNEYSADYFCYILDRKEKTIWLSEKSSIINDDKIKAFIYSQVYYFTFLVKILSS